MTKIERRETMALNQVPFAMGQLSMGGAEPDNPDANSKHAASFQNASRVQESFSAGIEKRVLLWMAARLPLWVTSDQLTALGLASMCLACACYVLARWHRIGFLLAPLCLALNW
ncbi:MAG TPA: hypothetical protein VGU63_03040, partial [Candidatus Acidoferrales bacterium]|nr:hypothetical protein [Candidatus Acidoferrales bacterium]